MNVTVIRSGLALTAACLATAIAFRGVNARLTVQSSEQRLADLIPAIENNLKKNIIPFWFPPAVDREHGGYTVHYGPKGEPLPGGTKAILTQARTLGRHRGSYGVSSGSRDFVRPRRRFRFLRDRMRDHEHGGFFWEVDVSGTRPLRLHKHLYGQAFGLYALSEYYLASGNPEARCPALRAPGAAGRATCTGSV